ncbi:MAG TPA: hypothetical protein VND87_13635 [Stellaceae bacterium]|nr:hypothetical protein [Stellaceae bacterium]
MTGDSLNLRTLGHATLALFRDGESPLLATDPWLVGSVYWRSWWLQHYPSGDEIDWLAGAANVYITHEHPDHLHLPSIRRLGTGPRYLFPDLPEPDCLAYLQTRGYSVAAVPPRRWQAVAPGIAMLSIPLWNDDSLLLVDTPDALILNFNDAKPLPPVLRAVRRLADRIGKRRVLLASYSPASLVNSFVDERGGIVSLRAPEHYVNFICRLCDRLGADVYLPFASQAVFERGDSTWANAHRTLYTALVRGWSAAARLAPPYATLNLADLSFTAPGPADYRPAAAATVARLTAARLAAEEAAEITDGDVAALRRKLNVWRFLLWPLFPRGFGFRLGRRRLYYEARRGRLGDVGEGPAGDFEIAVPALTIKEALANDHLTDLGITMFVRVRLFRRVDLRRIYGLFVLFQFHDYGHLRSPASLWRWTRAIVRDLLPGRLPALSAGSPAAAAPGDGADNRALPAADCPEGSR